MAAALQDVILAVKITQSLAVLEVVHAAVGLVRSPVFTTAQQVASRIFIVWGILVATPEAIQLGSVTPIKCDFVFDALTSIDDHVGLPMPVFVKSTAHFAANHIYQYRYAAGWVV